MQCVRSVVAACVRAKTEPRWKWSVRSAENLLPLSSNTTLQWYEKFFTVIKEKADTLKLLIDAGFRAEYLDIVNETVLRNPDIPVSKKYQRLIWTGGVENAIVYWINGGMRESIEDMAKFCEENLAAWSY